MDKPLLWSRRNQAIQLATDGELQHYGFNVNIMHNCLWKTPQIIYPSYVHADTAARRTIKTVMMVLQADHTLRINTSVQEKLLTEYMKAVQHMLVVQCLEAVEEIA